MSAGAVGDGKVECERGQIVCLLILPGRSTHVLSRRRASFAASWTAFAARRDPDLLSKAFLPAQTLQRVLEQIAHGFEPTLPGRIYYEVGEYASREPTDFVIEPLNHRQCTIGPGSPYCAGIIEFTPFTAIEVRAVSKPVWGLNT
jgi:hypothetical protein